jgi:hypothetical protein
MHFRGMGQEKMDRICLTRRRIGDEALPKQQQNVGLLNKVGEYLPSSATIGSSQIYFSHLLYHNCYCQPCSCTHTKKRALTRETFV